jgi:hypothetical protein
MPNTLRKWLILGEVALIYAAIVAYIWIIRYKYPQSAWLILLWIVISQWVIYRDRLPTLGLRLDNLRVAFAATFRLALPCIAGLVLIALMRYVLGIYQGAPGSMRFPFFYFISAFVQQYTLQGFFHRRLMQVFSDQGVQRFLVAVIFSTLHIPNPLLIGVTFIGGFYSAWLFTRYGNLIPLSLAHGMLGTALSRSLPGWLIHKMRVGPGYYLT